MDDIGWVSIAEIWHRDVDELHLLLLQDLNLLKVLQLILRPLSHLHHQYNQSARAVLSTREALTPPKENPREAPTTWSRRGCCRPTSWMSGTM